MKLVTFDGARIGVLRNETVHDVTDTVLALTGLPFPWAMNALCGVLADNLALLERAADNAGGVPLSQVRLGPPIPAPTHLFAAPVNFLAHQAEMQGAIASYAGTAEMLGFFTKASGSVSGPADPIELPDFPERRFDHEGEIAIVIGKEARGVSPQEALDHIAGYTIVLDVTMRMTETQREERTFRKSFHSFSPMGPCLLTSDEVPDPSALTLKLWLNGELRQDSSARDLIVDIPNLVSRASHVLPLRPGDVYITGSPAGVGQIGAGDRVRTEMPGLGAMELPVVLRAW